MKTKLITLLLLLTAAKAFAQNYELGVILLKVKQPNVVRFINGRVQNGSVALQNVFQQYPALDSRKLPHVNDTTDGCYRIEFPSDLPLKTIQSALSACSDIEFTTLNYYGIFSGIPDDTYWTDQWALQKIQMPSTWDISKGNSTILVGIMDSGLDYNHVDLTDNIWTNPNEIAGNGIDDDGNSYIDDIYGWDFEDVDNDPQEEGGSSHGTRVAGVIAAKTYNGTGIAGIAGGWQGQAGVKLIGLRIGTAFRWTQENAIEAITYLTWLKQQGYTVIANMSFQTDGIADEPQPLFESAVNAAKNAGVIMFAAAGNIVDNPNSPYNQANVGYLPIPAQYFGVMPIGASADGATLQNELRYSESLYPTEPDANKVLLVAPAYNQVDSGINVYTTFPGNGYINWFTGTSAASPIASGVAALMLSVNPSLTFGQISSTFKATAEKIGNYTYSGNPSRTDEVGYGRINAYDALKYTLENYGGTLSGEVLLTEDMTIQPGVTLNIDSGTILKFSSNAGLIINGTLNVNGTASIPVTFTRAGATGDWQGIEFKSGSSGTVSYAVIEKVYNSDGINILNASPTIEYTTIKDCLWGLNLNNANATIRNCTIDNNDEGVYDRYGAAQYSDNTITDSYGALTDGNGIIFISADPSLFGNLLSDNDTGVTGTSAAYAEFGSLTQTGNNVIRNNGNGVFSTSTNTYLRFGEYNTWGGDNSIYNNTTWDAIALNSSWIIAEITWWGDPGGGDVYWDATSGVYDDFPLSSDPNQGMAPKASAILARNAALGKTRTNGSIVTPASPFNTQKGMKNPVFNLLQMRHLFRAGKATGFIAYLDSVASAAAETVLGDAAQNMLALEYYLDGQYQNALNLAKKNKTDFANTDYEKFALQVLFDTYLYGLGDKTNSQSIIAELSHKYPNDTQTKRLQFESTKAGIQLSVKQMATGRNADHKAQSFALEQNYPNPFNPSTQIRYQLQEPTFVTLKVYNVMGVEIRALVTEMQRAGAHTLSWDGRDDQGQFVPSGVCFYQIVAGENVEKRKMLLIR